MPECGSLPLLLETSFMPKIFLSYASVDRIFVAEAYQRLVNAGFDVFFDHESLNPGDSFREKIDLALKSSDVIVYILSGKSLTSSYVQNELSSAKSSGTPVIPILVEKLPLPLPFWLSDIQVLDFSEHQEWQKLISACEIVSKYSRTELTPEALLSRVAELPSQESEKVYAARILLLGPGGAGKSSLANRLKGHDPEHAKGMTIGVDYLRHQPLHLHEIFLDFDLNDLDLFLWDFGGQTIFHGLHSAFLHENCVYVLVVDSRHEQAPDEWLYQIRHLAGSRAKVLLVTNWYERCETHQNKIRLLREFPDLLTDDSFFYFSCIDKDAPNFKRFVQSLVKVSLDSQKMVLKETLDVQRELDTQYQNTVFVHESSLKKLIKTTTQRNDTADRTINQLNQLGFLVRVVKQKNRYCLKPSWAVDNAYQLLYADALRTAGGVADMAMLEQALEGKEDAEHVEYLVEFLNERALCCTLDDGRYFFPDAAPRQRTTNRWQITGRKA